MVDVTDKEAIDLASDAMAKMREAATLLDRLSAAGFIVDATFRRIECTTLGDENRKYLHEPQVHVSRSLTKEL